MKTNIKIIVSTFLFLFTSSQIIAQEATEAHKDSLDFVIKKYYDLNLKIFQANSSKDAIDNVFDIFTEDFEYVHPKYGGVYSREDLYKGYVRNQENGRYDGSVVDIKIINKIIGLNAVVVQRTFVNNKDGEKKDGDREMTLFEFKNGKISRIFEYW